MHRVVNNGISQMIQQAPQMQAQLTQELRVRKDVNIEAIQAFATTALSRFHDGLLLPWLAQQCFAGYVLARSQSPAQRTARLRELGRFLIKMMLKPGQELPSSFELRRPNGTTPSLWLGPGVNLRLAWRR